MGKKNKEKKTPFLFHMTEEHRYLLDILVEKGAIASVAHGIRNALDDYLEPAKDVLLARATAPAREAARQAELRNRLSASKDLPR